jgi:hypothetical protein
VFDRRPEEALRHDKVGVSIGELSPDERLNGAPWRLVGNRPALRA